MRALVLAQVRAQRLQQRQILGLWTRKVPEQVQVPVHQQWQVPARERAQVQAQVMAQRM